MRYPTHKYYTVAIGNSCYAEGWTPCPNETCGHKHKTRQGAEKCQSKLIGYSSKTRTCSAKWYNSYILGAVLEEDRENDTISNNFWDR
jgi:hypothetical protein